MQLASTDSGAGFPLLVLHGLFGSSGNWASIARELAGDFAVHALDLRNHGNSPHEAVMTFDLMAQDVREFIRDRELGRVHLIGHSMGGKTAMRLAQLAPESVARLVVVDIAPGQTEADLAGIVQALRSVDLTGKTRRGEVGRDLARSIPSAKVRQFLLTNLRRDPHGGLSWKLNLQAIADNYNRLVGPIPSGDAFAGPVLFIRGERSNHIRPEDEAEIKRRFPRSSVETITGAGHWVHAEAPDRFLEAVRRFLLDRGQ